MIKPRLEIVNLDVNIYFSSSRVSKSGIWYSMILVLRRSSNSLADALITVYMLINITTVCRPSTHATILAVDVSARYNNILSVEFILVEHSIGVV